VTDRSRQSIPWEPLVHPDDVRLARIARELRRRDGRTQFEIARATGLSIEMVRRIESEHASGVSLATIRALLAPYEARVRTSVWLNGADLDRILDQEHADGIERVIQVLRGWRWDTLPEVSYSEWGERGSMDILGAHPAGVGVVVEVKADIGSTEEMNRSLDVKTRLAPKLIEERFGIRVATVGRLLVLPDQMRLRRLAARYSSTLDVHTQRGDVRYANGCVTPPADSTDSGSSHLEANPDTGIANSPQRLWTPPGFLPSGRETPTNEAARAVATRCEARGPDSMSGNPAE
jgi:transcriptional regulator with XRE-family HTH domain